MINTNKAAMFGLDARIALAIFGALSVISGAALYSAIKHARAIAFLTQIEEVAKAIDSYRIDTASDIIYNLTYSATDYIISYDSKLQHLVENTENLHYWKGPYISLIKYATKYLKLGDYDIFIGISGDRSTLSKMSQGQQCHKTNNACYTFIKVSPETTIRQQAINMFYIIDELVDNGDGWKNGKIQFSQVGNEYTDLDPDVVGSPLLLYKYDDFRRP